MSSIQIVEFPFDTTLFPSSLYGNKPYRVGNTGLNVPRSFKYEAERLIQKFLATSKFGTEGAYLRLDFFVDPNLEEIHLLEVNSRLVDGWGAGFSLARAAGQKLEEISAAAGRAEFPSLWHLPASNRVYRNDFDFAIRELCKLGISVTEIKSVGSILLGEWIYYYGWDRPEQVLWIAPSSGYEIENKVHLARFSQAWQGEQVKIPRGYSICNTAWENIPRDRVIFKFCEKHGEDSERARTSVLYPEEVGKGRFAKQCYGRGTIMAQDLVPTLEVDDKICQLILLASGKAVVTGYVIWAPRGTRIITDAYEHAPLIWR
jgi:hypothetical protein